MRSLLYYTKLTIHSSNGQLCYINYTSKQLALVIKLEKTNKRMAIYRELSSQLYSNPYVQEKARESMIRSFRSQLEESRRVGHSLGTKGQVQWMCGIQLLFLFFCTSICCSVYHINIAPNHFHIKSWKPMRATGSQIYFDKWPSHRLGSFTFFRSISNCTESDIRATKPLFDP